METLHMPGGIERPVIGVTPAPPPSEKDRKIHAAFLADLNSIRHQRFEAEAFAEQQFHTIERILGDYRAQEQTLFNEYSTLIRSADHNNIDAIVQTRQRRAEIHEIVCDIVLLLNAAKDRLHEARQFATEGAIRRAAEQRAVDELMK